MSLSDRRSFLGLLMAAPLAACGFAPAYGPQGSAGQLQGRVRMTDPTDKASFDFVDRLEARLGRPQTEVYDLAYVITTKAIGVGITTGGSTTRYNLTGRVNWTLTERASGARRAGGTVNSFTSYSATGSTVAGLAAEEDASLRLMHILADQIVTRLIAASGGW